MISVTADEDYFIFQSTGQIFDVSSKDSMILDLIKLWK